MKRLYGPFLVLLIIIGAGIAWFKEGSLPVDSQETTSTIFVVQPGTSVSEIANNLEKEKLIRSRLVFYLLVKVNGLEKKMQYGDFRLSRQMNALQVAEELTHGTLDVWVTVIEGMRVEEIASVVGKQLDIPESVFVSAAKAKEGFLFPDTYLVPKGASYDQIIAIFEKNFNNKVDASLRQAITDKGFSLKEAVIIASLLEREAQNLEDKQVIAGIIFNRLEIGMPLQIDATVQYALGYSVKEKSWWRKNLSASDLKIDSPYNTYLYPDLPPAPISNPGLESIQAVAQAKLSDYFYYITDKKGIMHYAKTLKEHNQNISQYLN